MKSTNDLEDGDLTDQESFLMEDGMLKQQLQRMYKVSKKNIEKDNKLQEYFKKTEKHLKKLDESTKRVKKDLET